MGLDCRGFDLDGAQQLVQGDRTLPVGDGQGIRQRALIEVRRELGQQGLRPAQGFHQSGDLPFSTSPIGCQGALDDQALGPQSIGLPLAQIEQGQVERDADDESVQVGPEPLVSAIHVEARNQTRPGRVGLDLESAGEFDLGLIAGHGEQAALVGPDVLQVGRPEGDGGRQDQATGGGNAHVGPPGGEHALVLRTGPILGGLDRVGRQLDEPSVQPGELPFDMTAARHIGGDIHETGQTAETVQVRFDQPHLDIAGHEIGHHVAGRLQGSQFGRPHPAIPGVAQPAARQRTIDPLVQGELPLAKRVGLLVVVRQGGIRPGQGRLPLGIDDVDLVGRDPQPRAAGAGERLDVFDS